MILIVGMPPTMNSTNRVDPAVALDEVGPHVTARGFGIDEAEVAFWGLCPSCQTTSESHEKENAR